MKSVFVLLVVLCTVLSAVDCISRIRYANSMPQFGSSTVKAFLPSINLFSSVPGGFLTNYINITNKPWIFTASYPTNVSALSYPYFLSNNAFYSLFTYQSANHQLLNGLVTDLSSAPNSSVAYLRTINLLQHNFELDVYNISNNVQLFSNTSYGVATNYRTVPPGDYVVYWTSTTSKRNLETGGNVSGDPFLFGGSAYTYWILPTGSFIVPDGVITAKRSVAVKRSLKTKKEMKLQTLLKGKDNEATNSNGSDADVQESVDSDQQRVEGGNDGTQEAARQTFVQSR